MKFVDRCFLNGSRDKERHCSALITDMSGEITYYPRLTLVEFKQMISKEDAVVTLSQYNWKRIFKEKQHKIIKVVK